MYRHGLFVLVVYLFSRLCILGIVFFLSGIGGTLPPNTAVLAEKEHLFRYEKNVFVDAMSRWDGGQYLSIVFEGYNYTEQVYSNVAFFPLYPLLISVVTQYTGIDAPVVGVILSNLFFLAALYVLYDFCHKKWGEKTARWTVVLLTAFPTSFFTAAIYTESLFLLLSALTFWFLERKYWVCVGVVGLLASATRLIGIMLFPMAVLLAWESVQTEVIRYRLISFLRRLLLISPMVLGLLAYMFFLYLQYGQPLLFIQVQNAWGSNKFNFIQTFQDIFNIVTLGYNTAGFTMMLSSILAILFFFITLIQSFKRLPIAYSVYAIALFFIPLGIRAESLLRYTGVILPLFIALALSLEKYKHKDYFVAVSAVLQVFFLVQFIELRQFY